MRSMDELNLILAAEKQQVFYNQFSRQGPMPPVSCPDVPEPPSDIPNTHKLNYND